MRNGLDLAVLTVLTGLAVGIPTSCGEVRRENGSGVRQLVTRDYGSEVVGESDSTTIPTGQTVRRSLEREFAVEPRDGGDVCSVCNEVTTRLDDAGISRVARTALNGPGGFELLRVVVGPWAEVRRDPTVGELERAPQASGVSARLLEKGRRLALYDGTGRLEQTLGAGAGLVAATHFATKQPTWVVTGTDAAGAAVAAGAMTEKILSRRFALALIDGRPVRLPLDSQRRKTRNPRQLDTSGK